ncbi:hypothetical protein [Helicobacter winghamensis]|uniref:Lipoprotein n=1 Tax=Helicobacter winghamensis TaxID=157268 RepID=A0A2N3PK45_9HELI|nr:hypothetical protein [Helicobacter winghamensis]EEO26023.1 hypothetical protein HWAG_00815 [Helicobacter winghamensis ATCC BAA-430]PKT77957.1 hypothetical protein BCM32_04975 [Helicobacter winghamensis]PKT78781.1 hypothetical protein BCM34_04335 [Helicobacter winghamensis]PKT78815.1 hypothetical protein BCM35_02840 [Helicobacter winghamensis]PKT81755.1 hypothetical protein BCM31_06410 [Helicobacter winghamensis]
MKIYKTLLVLVMTALLLNACANKELVVKREYKEVLTPTLCPLKLPLKPTYKGTLESAKEISIYYLEVEDIAKRCTSNNLKAKK